MASPKPPRTVDGPNCHLYLAPDCQPATLRIKIEQVNPTWVRFDGTYLWLTATTRRQKTRNWQIQPAVALSILDPDLPSRYLEIRGRVERIVADPEAAEFLRLADRYGMEHPGPPADAPDRIAVAIRPLHTTTQ
jgi:PPOX class probable F420-dependent enzyme